MRTKINISSMIPKILQKMGSFCTPNFDLKLSILRWARICPDMPGYARTCGAGRARSKPFPHAPEHRRALVGKAQLPQTTTYYYLLLLTITTTTTTYTR